MNGYYRGKIKVVTASLKCFPVDPMTLEATATGTYDPWALSDPDPEPVETITHSQWLDRIDRMREFQYRKSHGVIL